MNVDDLALALGVGAARGARAMAKAVSGGKSRTTREAVPAETAAADAKLRVVALGDAVAKALEEAGHEALRVRAERGRLPIDDGAADALCASGLPDPSVAPLVLNEFVRVVRHGGRILVATSAGLVGRGPERQLLTALFIHAGLVDIEQQMARGTAITSGRVRRG
jgi:ubiquinone/menaquinone biosynthesis C-methylase UbiE